MIASDRTPTLRRRGRIGFRRPLLGLLAAMALLAGSSLTTAYADDLSANLSCDDGTNLNLNLDLISLQGLTDSVQAMLLYPAGLSCSVTQLTNPGLASRVFSGFVRNAFADSGNPKYDYAVGGGQAQIVARCIPDNTNFALSAHTLADTPTTGVHGSANLTIPDCTSVYTTTTYGPSDLRTDVDCLVVSESGTDAVLTAHVEEATGVFASSAEFPSFGLQGREIALAVHDSGLPGGTGDKIGWDFGTSHAPCDAAGFAAALASEVPVDFGNINIHDAN